MITVMLCLTIASVVFGVMLRAGLTEWRLVKAQERRMQAAWLAESALQRAVARLAADSEYQGETWTIRGDELQGSQDAVVLITIEPTDGPAPGRLIQVRADYPPDGEERSRESRQTIDTTNE